MSVKFGDKSIKKVYMGDKEIKKIYKEDKLVYQNKPPLLYGTLDAGYYGRVECSDFITLTDISNQLENKGIPNPHWENCVEASNYSTLEQYWHHFSFKNKDLYWYSIPLFNYGDSTNKLQKQIERFRWRLFSNSSERVFTENDQWGTHYIIIVKEKKYYLRLLRQFKENNEDSYSEISGLIVPLLQQPVFSNSPSYVNPNWGANYTREQLGLGNGGEYWGMNDSIINQHPKITETLMEDIYFHRYNTHSIYRGKVAEFYNRQPIFSTNRLIFRPLLERID